jgi:hypothetical protein
MDKRENLRISMEKYGSDLKSYCNVRKLENVTNGQKKRDGKLANMVRYKQDEGTE